MSGFVSRMVRLSAASLLGFSVLAASPALADKNRKIIDQMVGTWAGKGQLEYTEIFTFPFRCEIEGKPGVVRTQVDLIGKCWSGPFWGRMAAALRYDPKSGSYRGIFRDNTQTFVIQLRGRRAGKAVNWNLAQGTRRASMSTNFADSDKVNLTLALINNKTQQQRQVINLQLQRTVKQTASLRRK